ncbi:hypothetical protein [Salinibacter ruber]|uniref:hypothetical protein n=1 Tax=Salinibacter ruber TaxID=146919 RepID=UPI002074A0D8|nr:hypothetical protein [Salinibacter ruber]
MQHAVFPKIEDVDLVRNDLYGLISSSSDKKTLVSHEPLCGYPWKNEYPRKRWIEEFERNAKNIGITFDKPNCIIGFRRHDRLIKSLYKQYLHEGNTEQFRDFFRLDGSGIVTPDDLRFRRRLRIAEKYFSRVLVYTQERLKDELEAFLVRLSNFLGTKKVSINNINREKYNAGVKSKFQVKSLRSLNRINDYLKKSPFPTLHNRIFKTLGLTPRELCQKCLRGIGKEEFTLPKDVKKYVKKELYDDWKYVCEKAA